MTRKDINEDLNISKNFLKALTSFFEFLFFSVHYYIFKYYKDIGKIKLKLQYKEY